MTQKKAPQKARVRVGPLRNTQEVTKYMARLLKKAAKGAGGGEVNDAYKLAMIASMLIKSMEVSLLEARIDTLERERHG